MAAQCTCPAPAAIDDLLDFTCSVTTKRINKIAFQRTGNTFTDILLESEWDTLIAAIDDTKIQFSPLFASFELPSSESIVFGGDDNTTPNGEPIVTGETSVTATGIFLNTPQNVITALKGMASCEAGIGVYLIDEENKIIYEGATPTGSPIPILPNTFFVGTFGNGGATEPNTHNFSFSLAPCWSANITIDQLPFDLQAKLN